MSFKTPEEYRITKGRHASDGSYGNNGAFQIPCKKYEKQALLNVIVSDGKGWEHVSVSLANAQRTPVWEEMCFVKNLFWDSEDCVMQYHPPKANYVNQHPYTLHLWRPTNVYIPVPQTYLVGMQSVEDSEVVFYNALGMLSPDQQEERRTVADNMETYGGSFVTALGKLVRHADPENMMKLKQMFPDYWEEYKNWDGGDGEEG